MPGPIRPSGPPIRPVELSEPTETTTPETAETTEPAATPLAGETIPEGPTRESVAASLGRAPKPPTESAASSTTPRAGTELLVGNPLTDAKVHSSVYAAVPAAMGFALDKLAEKFPDVDRHFATRFLEMALVVGAEVPFMTYSHEAGHYRAAAAAGANPEIEMTGWMGGLTRYNVPKGVKIDAATRTAMTSAGVNQEQLNAVYMFQKWARNGGARYQEAMGYLLAQTNLALYAANTARRTLQGDVKSSDDISNYLRQMEKRGSGLKLGHLVAISAATDLASAPVWAAIIGQIRFLAKGDRTVEMPTFKIGNVESTFPSLHTLLTSKGPVVGGNILIDPKGKIPVELTFDVRIDREGAAALGVKLYDVPIGDRLSVNPFIRGTYDTATGAGIAVGTDFKLDLYKGVALTGSVEFSHNDLLAEPTGSGNDLRAHVGISIPF